MERFGRSVKFGRELFLADLRAADDLRAPLEFPTKHFVAMLAWDSSSENVETIGRLAELLLRSGCAYVVAWGDGCSRIDDIVDLTAVCLKLGVGERGAPLLPPEQNPFAAHPTVMTTWHANDTLEEALDFFLLAANPVEEFEATCGSAIVIAIGQPPAVIEQIRARLMGPET
jgi:hypothetical protein